MARLDALQARISVQFRRPELLREAMTHASWNNERGRPSGPGHDNERLEYLGDAVLELVVGENLFKRFPTYDEGQLTQLRAALVNTMSLARMAERLGIGDVLLLGKGAAKTGANRLPSLLANAFEAMIGATFLDQGYRVATRVFIQTLGNLDDWTDTNFKGRLQESAQERFGQTPHYRVAASGGPGHRREYVAEAVVGDEVVGTGKGTTKQAAEQAAARAALDAMRPGRGRRRARSASATTDAPRRTRAAAAPRTAPPAEEKALAGAAAAVAPETPRPTRSRRSRAKGPAEVAAAAVSVEVREEPEPATAPPALAVEPAAPPAKGRRRGLLSVLRTAAEVITGLQASRPVPQELPVPVLEPHAVPGAAPAAGATPVPSRPPPDAVTAIAAGGDPGGATDPATESGTETARPRTRRGRRGGRSRRADPAAAPADAAVSAGPEVVAAPPPAGVGATAAPRPRSRRRAPSAAAETRAPEVGVTSATRSGGGRARRPRAAAPAAAPPTTAPAETAGSRPRRRTPRRAPPSADGA